MKKMAYLTGFAGLALVTLLVLHEGFQGIVATLAVASWALVWLIPFHLLPVGIDALGWRQLLGRRRANANYPYLAWVATVRYAVNNLLPVARVGGEIVGIRLAVLGGVPTSLAAASVLVELTMTLIATYLFTLLGLALLTLKVGADEIESGLLAGMLIALPLLIGFVLLQRYGSIFARLERMLTTLAGGHNILQLVGSPALLDAKLRHLYRRHLTLLRCALWQFASLIAAAMETWLALYLLGHSVSFSAAVVIESLTQAARHVAFVVPAGLGVQEASLVFFGKLMGLSPEVSVALSFAKRLRDFGFGVPVLISWQWVEGRQLRGLFGGKSHQSRS
jgi:putative membrane protein